MTRMLQLPDRLTAAGVNVRTLDGWDTPAKPGYVWREPDGEPAGVMHHHTATTAYTPNRDKANGWAGLSLDGSDRLYQEDYGDGLYSPVLTIANAYPAPVSSGKGRRAVLDDFVKLDVPYVGTTRFPDDDPPWYGNTHYFNFEWVVNGTGAPVDAAVWDMMVTVCKVINDLYRWTPARHIGHGHHTPTRKIDLRDGVLNYDQTVSQLRKDMTVDVDCPWDGHAPWLTTYPRCTRHWTDTPIEWGVNTGVCNVPSWGEESVRRQIERRIINLSDNGRDNFDDPMSKGEWWVFADRGNPHP